MTTLKSQGEGDNKLELTSCMPEEKCHIKMFVLPIKKWFSWPQVWQECLIVHKNSIIYPLDNEENELP